MVLLILMLQFQNPVSFRYTEFSFFNKKKFFKLYESVKNLNLTEVLQGLSKARCINRFHFPKNINNK